MPSKWPPVKSLLAILLLCSVALGQSRELPNVASQEIARRANHVEKTGATQGSLVREALSPPKDDSSKWFITLVVDDSPESRRMRSIVERSPEMAAWINAKDPQQSPTHYHCRHIDDRTQQDWLAAIKKLSDKKGLPVIVAQPPNNGRFGRPATVVKMVHGVTKGEDLAQKLRDGIIAYVRTIEQKREQGITARPPYDQEPPEEKRPANDPPFPVRPPAPRPDNAFPFDWPPSQPAQPHTLTVEQILEACPDASPEFVVYVMRSKETDLKAVRLEWTLWKLQAKFPGDTGGAPGFFHPSHNQTYLLAGIAALVVVAVMAHQKGYSVGKVAPATAPTLPTKPVTRPASVGPSTGQPSQVQAAQPVTQ